MNGSVHTQRRIGLLGVVLAVAVLSGCASRVSVPVRDGNGVAPAPATAAVPSVGVHVVKPGETLLAIARQHGQSVRDLVAWNNLANPNQIHVGQELRVVSPESTANGAVATAIPITSEPAVAMPVVPQPATGGAIKLEPKGGKQAYSDDVWAKVRRSGDAAPTGEVKPEVAPPPQVPAQESADAEWLWPAKGRILNGFNEATNKGVDIAGNPGDPVIASAAGRVVYAGSGLRGYGKLVIIKHNQEYNSVYAHNQKLLVKEDDQVAKGQKIAELGSTDADRPKLHFEIRKQGRPVDPMKFLSAR